MSTSQLGFSKNSRSSVKTQFTASKPSSHLTAKAQTESIRSKLWKRISAPSKSTVRSSPVSTSRNVTDLLLTFVTMPVYVSANDGPENSNTICGWSLSHWPNTLQNLSADELMFVSHIYNWGFSRAKCLAAKFHYKLRQPLPVLLEALCELDRNCTKRSAKPRPLSNSPTSSKKHSSGT
jgi:hypothetical protein